MIMFYGYAKCSTCRKAKAYLQQRGVAFQEIDITTHPPSQSVLQSIVASGAYRLTDLLNRSGELYRSLKMKDKVNTLTESQLLDLLATHGRLIKRPVVSDGTRHVVGYDEARLSQFAR